MSLRVAAEPRLWRMEIGIRSYMEHLERRRGRSTRSSACCASRTRTSSRCRRRTTARPMRDARRAPRHGGRLRRREQRVRRRVAQPPARDASRKPSPSRAREDAARDRRSTAGGSSRRICRPDARERDEPRRIAEAEAIRRRSPATIARRRLQRGPSRTTRSGCLLPRSRHRPTFVSRRPVELVLEAGSPIASERCNPGDRELDVPRWHPWARLDYVFARRLPRSCEVVETDASRSLRAGRRAR